MTYTWVFLSLGCLPWALAGQTALPRESFHDDHFQFAHQIERVAVIGGGGTGLLHAATLIEHGFKVRLFEKQANPGGNWLYNDKAPLPAAPPNRPLQTAAYIPDIPPELPRAHVYSDGDEGLSNEWRLREHWIPSSTWFNMVSTVPPFMMSLPNIQYPSDTPWKCPQHAIQRVVRQYASSKGLNLNDEEHGSVSSYSTRVERVHKHAGSNKWTLTLRRLVEIPYSSGKLRADWWTEEFDAVVVGTNSESDSPWVPPIPGLSDWANAHPEAIYHVRNYRRPESFLGKKVLIVGGFLSASGVATDITPYASSVLVSVRNKDPERTHFIKRAVRDQFPPNATFIAEIKAFSKLNHQSNGITHASVRLANGTEVSGFDHIILATGYRKSFPFLADYHNGTIVGYDEPETKIAPILTDGSHLRSLHWTGHYIPDPTLVVATVHPWGLGGYQSLGVAKVWSGKARLPSTANMWKEYPGAGRELFNLQALGEVVNRLFITWLNDASLEFGGRLVDPLPWKDRQAYEYFSEKEWLPGYLTAEYYDALDEAPRSQWPVRNGKERMVLGYQGIPGTPLPHIDDWMEFTNRW